MNASAILYTVITSHRPLLRFKASTEFSRLHPSSIHQLRLWTAACSQLLLKARLSTATHTGRNVKSLPRSFIEHKESTETSHTVPHQACKHQATNRFAPLHLGDLIMTHRQLLHRQTPGDRCRLGQIVKEMMRRSRSARTTSACGVLSSLGNPRQLDWSQSQALTASRSSVL